jgi:DNA-binding GntR family transcriptional regulator
MYRAAWQPDTSLADATPVGITTDRSCIMLSALSSVSHRSSGRPPLPNTRTQVVANELRRLIQSGELPPGTRLRQADIAQRIGVSTTPVREALFVLAREGLVRQDAHRGAIVFSPSLDELDENYEIRLALEPLATRAAAEHITEAEIRTLEKLNDKMRSTSDSHRYVKLNRLFHQTIYDAARRPTLAELIDRLRDAAAAYLSLLEDVDDPTYAAQVQDEHERVVAALRAHQVEAAGQVMEEHLRSAEARIARRIAENEPRSSDNGDDAKHDLPEARIA